MSKYQSNRGSQRGGGFPRFSSIRELAQYLRSAADEEGDDITAEGGFIYLSTTCEKAPPCKPDYTWWNYTLPDQDSDMYLQRRVKFINGKVAEIYRDF